ncbi:Alpha-1,2-galactosyltransferase [Schizosaccharomyces pombe]|uniref:Alpha-1,2-galactosyltransferase n=1 Tax=Schizosaccharomyces pombe (strain 972 / ATCC 24843) TaxID=284812 RepID=GMA12_SCHPO|nr:alpha-1,2-galactosyltransferase Gma12 [Schizosaccharomyces pombe]Q09174.1 RecName: Full=Alpha-1,2-galactosyltransferase [Schizosaccharomyces pombe 972h-]CAA19268.1 alpha-1,2-galactosyltransferase Gma12 [Schizosaccharomyces pombe]CAA83200.1 alpha-1,2-galactosyltransferase [Schizosaccharomyces pombe]|eukprot:NP_587775.1 alpha-1,2-galactosyltransferase Gma12 [Schizosaccharomyces pombe]
MRFAPYLISAVVITTIILGGAWWTSAMDTKLQTKMKEIIDQHTSTWTPVVSSVTSTQTDTLRVTISEVVSVTATLTETFTATPTVTSVVHALATTDPHPDNSKIVILMGSNFQNDANSPLHPFAQSIIKNRREYAERHGYKFEFLDADAYASRVTGHLMPWVKVPMLQDTMKKYPDAEWIWWLDHDALVMNKDLNVVDHVLKHDRLNTILTREAEYKSGAGIPADGFRTPKDQDAKDVHFIISQDFNGINAGSLFIRNSEVGRWIVDLWFEPLYLDHIQGYAEQQAFSHMVFYHPQVYKHVGVVPLKAINAYDFDDNIWGYDDGDLCIHFAGCNYFKNCPEKFLKYAQILSSKQGSDWMSAQEKDHIQNLLKPSS